ncbi:hypothetical protein [Gardnerella swidsinskii]
MTTTLFSATTLLFAHAKIEASDTSQAGQLVFLHHMAGLLRLLQY